MRVGEIDTSGSEFWLYQPGRHKTLEKTGERVIPLDAEEQALIAPYLVGKKPENAVFSPRTAMQELGRKPSKLVGEFYNKNSYKQAIEYAVTKVNKTLPPEQQIPLWTPYQLRHLAGSKMRLEQGVDATQTFLGHASPDTQKHYTHLQVEAMKKLKRETRGQRNPLAGIEEKMS